ncbi:S-layer homology domain-containing protein [uncultured Oscillibacter sp.]|uniref:S-layer homology domain-containing protein n=1 Tax=uncultured Oscillibacter sp. TaxID=876091 RepID=UPI002805F5A6|nr:S-layer homology domain-containing protein [uncultured Oscillibacter sp.]
MRTQRKIWAVLLAICLLTTCLPVSAMAAGTEGEAAFSVVDKNGKELDNGGSYYTFEAVLNMPNLEKVVLAKNLTENITIPKEKTVTLDLGGKTLTNKDDHTISNHGTLTIIGEGTVANTTESKGALANYQDGVAHLNGGTFTNTSWYTIKNLGEITIDGATVTTTNEGKSSLIDNGWYGDAKKVNDLGQTYPTGSAAPVKLTIESGIFDGGMNTVKNDDFGVLVIEDGSFFNTVGAVIMNWHDTVINGGDFVLNSEEHPLLANGYLSDTADKGQMTINGGTFRAASLVGWCDGNKPGGTLTVNGGTFEGYFGGGLPYTLAIKKGAFNNMSALKYLAAGADVKVTLTEDQTGSGYVVKDGQKVEIDFGGHTYTVNEPLVGSTGTETNAFQLKKSATVIMQNGTMQSNTAAIMIQNYCDLTLKDMNLIGSADMAYVSSNNCGKVNITGKTNIIAAEGKVAFDVCWAPNKTYPEGTQVTVNTTGTIDGIIELGLWGDFAEPVKSTLKIENGKFTGAFRIDEKMAKQITISGGTFAADPTPYLADGLTAVLKDGVYTVGKAVTGVTLSQATLTLAPGGSASLTATVAPEDALEKTVTWTTSDAAVATVASGTVTAVAEGTATITAAVGGKSATCVVTVNQTAPLTCVVTFAVTPEGATVVVKDGETVVPANADGTYTLEQGKAYAYTVSADGYVTETGALTATESKTVTVTLVKAAPATAVVTFAVTPADAAVEVKDGETVVPANADGTYTLEQGKAYAYTVSADGYVTETGALTATEDKTVTVTLVKAAPATAVVTFSVTPADAAVEVKDGETAVAPSADGTYTLEQGKTYTYTVSASGYVTKSGTVTPAADETITVALDRKSSGGGGGGGGSSSSSSTSTETETKKNSDGSTVTTVTDKKTGEVKETVKAESGVTGTTVTDKSGNVTEVQASVPSTAAREAAENGEAVKLPVEVPSVSDPEEAPAVAVTVPKRDGGVKVEIPVEKVTPGTVAVLVKADGTEEIVKTSLVTEDGVVLTLTESATVKIVDNSKDFADVPENYWAGDVVAFVTSRELFTGTSASTFTPEAPTTRAQLMTVMARLDGADTSDSPLEQGMAWAVESGISDGTAPDAVISRQQLATMLYRYAGAPAAPNLALTQPDADAVADYAADALRWAIDSGILTGKADGRLDPTGPATRAQVAAMVARFCAWIG